MARQNMIIHENYFLKKTISNTFSFSKKKMKLEEARCEKQISNP